MKHLTETHEGGLQYHFSMSHHLEFFSKAGSLFTKRSTFYDQPETAIVLFQRMWAAGDKKLAMQLLFWLRDPRGGAGNRSGFRECINWLAGYEPDWVIANVHLIPEHGRWDDLRALYGTPAERIVANLWAKALVDGNVLAAKWADRNKDKPVKHALGMKVADFRRMLAHLRKRHIVEHKMSTNRWNEIDFDKVPSVAFARYRKAFERHTPERFAKFMDCVRKGDASIHADAMFPHDLMRLPLDDQLDTLFDQLPDFYDTSAYRVLPVVDVSNSMYRTRVSGSIRAIDVSIGLGLYCSDRMGASAFRRRLLIFSDEGKLVTWVNKEFHEVVDALRERGDIGSTQIYKALITLLRHAVFFSVPHEHMPNVLLILSDMQFHNGADAMDKTEVESAMQEYAAAGYEVPRIVYWNLAGYAGSQAKAGQSGVALISGFSPATLRHAFEAGFDPIKTMRLAAKKYKVVEP